SSLTSRISWPTRPSPSSTLGRAAAIKNGAISWSASSPPSSGQGSSSCFATPPAPRDGVFHRAERLRLTPRGAHLVHRLYGGGWSASCAIKSAARAIVHGRHRRALRRDRRQPESARRFRG